jgi:hypothetical protein
MAKSLEEIRKKLQELNNRRGPRSGGGDKTLYRHWDIPTGSSAIVRLLPDANEENTFFWTERQLFKFPFPGIKGHDEKKPIVVQVPCIEMWDGKNTCPVLNEVRPWWKDESLKAIASQYWIKRNYYMQGFIVQDPLSETEKPENPIRKFSIKPQIYAIIQAALMDPEMKNSPVNYVNGRNFVITKTSKGGFADYTTSKWSMNESALTPEQLAEIEQYKLVDLATYLPKRPTAEQLAIIYDMFQASLEGELYDPEKWAAHYKPFGFDTGAASTATVEDDDDEESHRPVRPVARPSSLILPKVEVEEVVEEEVVVETPKVEVKEEAKVTTPAPAGKSPQEILAMLRNRNK